MSFRSTLPAVGLALASLVVRGADGARPFDPDLSRIEVMVRSTMHSFVGRLERYEAKVVFGHDGRIGIAEVHFLFTDLHTGWERRDRAMYDWEQTSRFPDGEYRLQAIVAGEDGTLQAHGSLRLHGKTRELVFPVSVLTDHATWAIDGETLLDLRDFDLPPPRVLGFVKVEPLVRIRFHLQGARF